MKLDGTSIGPRAIATSLGILHRIDWEASLDFIRVLRTPLVRIFLLAAPLIFPPGCDAQVNYVARFTLEKQTFLQGEPVFCDFVIQNTGARTFVFRYRTPERVLNRALENEPHFTVTTEKHTALGDPAPRPCGGAKGSPVYGSVTLPPGAVHTERWLLNEWAKISRPGRYLVRAERRLPLLAAESDPPEFSAPPVAYAGAINELGFEVMPGSETGLRAVFQPYLKMVTEPVAADPAIAVLVLATLPQPGFLDRLEVLARAPADERRWDRRRGLEGLARLGTPAAWTAMKIATALVTTRESALGVPLLPPLV